MRQVYQVVTTRLKYTDMWSIWDFSLVTSDTSTMCGANISYFLLIFRCMRSRLVMCMSVCLTFQSAVYSLAYRNILRDLANDVCACCRLPVSDLWQVSRQYHYQVQYVLTKRYSYQWSDTRWTICRNDHVIVILFQSVQRMQIVCTLQHIYSANMFKINHKIVSYLARVGYT